MEIVILSGPWRSTEIKSRLSAIENGLKQLKYYRDVEHNDTTSLANDIKGYEMILDSGFPEENAEEFIKLKRSVTIQERRAKANIGLIEVLREKGLWK